MQNQRFFDFRPFGPRDPHEAHRAATPLELLFDLVSVIAIAAAAAGLHHAIVEGHATGGIRTFLMAFFAVWWAWMNYAWYASAYDNDGPVYRLLSLWIMGGALILAAGIPRFYSGPDLTLGVIGYIVMRIGMIALWLIAAARDPAHAPTARKYAVGIALAQVYWTGLLLAGPADPAAFTLLFALGAALELAVPAVAERGGMTPWHRHHIMERYGLLNIIVLGEVLLAGSMALGGAADRLGLTEPLVHVALAALVVAGSMWWLYFSPDEHLRAGTGLRRALQWGYGHFAIFASGAAVGAGFAVLADILAGHGEASLRDGDLAVAIPLAVYMAMLWLVRDRYNLAGPGRHVLLAFAAMVLVAGLFLPAPLELVAALCALSVAARSVVRNRNRIASPPVSPPADPPAAA